MAFIIKPLVTEKMSRISEQSSEDKKLRISGKKAEALKAEGVEVESEEVTYTVKSKKKGDYQKTVTVYTITKPAQVKYGFIVRPEANKIEIKKEIEAKYNVKVVSVNTMNYAGKRKSRYTKAGVIKGSSKAYKKAIVTLAAGETIDFYSNI